MMKKTKFYNDVERKWVLIDAKDKVLGRLATRIARILQGKNKSKYSPNFICGDNVIVVNAKYVRFTGNKLKDKIYDKYSGYPSGRKEITLEKLKRRILQRLSIMPLKGCFPRMFLRRE